MKTKLRKTSRFILALQRIKSGLKMKYMASGFCFFTLFPIIDDVGFECYVKRQEDDSHDNR